MSKRVAQRVHYMICKVVFSRECKDVHYSKMCFASVEGVSFVPTYGALIIFNNAVNATKLNN